MTATRRTREPRRQAAAWITAIRTSPLSVEEREQLDNGLRVAAETAGGPLPLSADQVQKLFDRLLGREDLAEALVVGLAFGELMRQECPFEWVRVIDDSGSETGLGLGDFPIPCSPIGMIRIRLCAGRPVDLEMLAYDTATAWLGSAAGWFERRVEQGGSRN